MERPRWTPRSTRRGATPWPSSGSPWAAPLASGWPSATLEIAGLALVNPLLMPPDEATVSFVQSMVDGGDEVAPGIGSDIAMEGVVESAYDGLPLRAVLSLSPRRAKWRPRSSR